MRVYSISENTQTSKLGFTYAAISQEALDVAFALLGVEAKFAVLRRGGEILPVVKESK